MTEREVLGKVTTTSLTNIKWGKSPRETPSPLENSLKDPRRVSLDGVSRERSPTLEICDRICVN